MSQLDPSKIAMAEDEDVEWPDHASQTYTFFDEISWSLVLQHRLLIANQARLAAANALVSIPQAQTKKLDQMARKTSKQCQVIEVVE